MSWVYRPALDGVRTLAVYLVVLFHAGVGFLDGGFVGVDLFFVLSGFLVSSILLDELDRTGRLDLAHFYDRRIRRLLPAAVLLVVATSAASLVVLSAVRRAPLVGDAQAALLYVANWRFLLLHNDYFGVADVHSSLYLHFWSLSIEEQFYLAFPLLLIGLTRLERRRRGATVAVLGLLFAGSVTAQVVWSGIDANHAYYATETRLYQLFAGVLLAVVSRRAARLPRPGRTATSLVSLACLAGLLVVASSLVDLSVSQRGLAATGLAVGLVATLSGAVGGPTARLFSLAPLVYLGKISYGTYLWHWPVIVLLREIVQPSPAVRTVIVVVLSTAFASASYHMLERPIRERRLRPSVRLPVVVAGLTTSLVVALLVVPPVLHQDRKPDLVAQRAVVLGTEANLEGPVPDIDFVAVRNDKGSDPRHCSVADLEDCAVVRDQPGPHVVLVGDSYGQMLGPAMTALAEQHGFNLSASIVPGCPWQLGVVKARNTRDQQRQCAEVRSALYADGLAAMDADVVVLTQRSRDDSAPTPLTRPPGDDSPEVSEAELLVESSRRTFAALRAADVRVVVVNGIWSPGRAIGDPLECLATARRLEQCRVPVRPASGLLDSLYRAAAAQSPDVVTLDLNPIMCPAAPVCDPVIDGTPVWRDARHYSPAALHLQRHAIWEAIRRTGVLDDPT